MFSGPDKLINIENYTMDEIWEKFLKPGSKDTYTHKVKSDPSLVMGYKLMYTAHSIEAGNLKKILENLYK